MAAVVDGAPGPAARALPGAGLDVEAWEAEVERAHALFLHGRPAAATRLLRSTRRRAERLGDLPGALVVVARTLVSEAAPHFDMTGDLPGALALIEKAEKIADRVDAPFLAAKVAGQRALVVLRSGDTQAAFELFDVAVTHVAHALPRDQALIMLNRGVLHLEHAHLAQAGQDLVLSTSYAENAGDDRLAAMARHNLGFVDFLAGRIPRALAAFEEAARTIPGGSHPAMVLDHARALREAGLLPEAESILSAAAARVREARLFQDLGETELVRAECALADGRPAEARRLAAAAGRRFTRRKNLRWQRKAELLVLRCERAGVGAGRGRRAALLRIAQRATELAQACRLESRTDLARAAELLAAGSRLRAGEPTTADTRLRRGDPLAMRLQLREVRALQEQQAGHESRAMAEVRRGLDELGSFQGALGSLDLRTGGAVHGVALARLGVDLAVRRGRGSGLLDMVEQSRAVSTRLPLLRPPRDERTARLIAELRQVEEESRGREGDDTALAEVTRLRNRSAALQRDLRARAWELEGDGRARTTHGPRAGEVRAAARERDTTFVCVVEHAGAFVAAVVTGDGVLLETLAPVSVVAELVRRVRADLDAAANPHLPAAIAATVRTSLRHGLARLDALLLEPLHVDGQLALSCSGSLAVLPWTLLPSRFGLPTVVTPGAGTWLRGLAAPRPDRPVVATLAGPGLHESEKEARDVASTWRSDSLLVGEQATTAAARATLARADLLHVAAHGTHRGDSPLFSSVRLADGALYAYELDAEDGMPGCVTLSACEAGLVTLRAGDEGLGLTHVLLHLGVVSVVAGVARVRDDVAATTMRHVHQEMASGATSAQALATAQLAGGTDALPAPFVTFGAPW